MKFLFFLIGLTILWSCDSSHNNSYKEKHSVQDSLPKFTKLTDNLEHITYYSTEKPSAEAFAIYKKTTKELSVHNIDFCKCYLMIDTLSTMSDKEGDYQYPLNPDKSSKYAERWFEREMRKLLKDNDISYKTGNNVWNYGYYFCPPKYK